MNSQSLFRITDYAKGKGAGSSFMGLWILAAFQPGILRSHVLSFFLFSFFGCSAWHMEFPSQASNLSHSCPLGCSCSSVGSLTHCAWAGDWSCVPVLPECRRPIAPQWELLTVLYWLKPSEACPDSRERGTDPVAQGKSMSHCRKAGGMDDTATGCLPKSKPSGTPEEEEMKPGAGVGHTGL